MLPWLSVSQTSASPDATPFETPTLECLSVVLPRKVKWEPSPSRRCPPLDVPTAVAHGHVAPMVVYRRNPAEMTKRPVNWKGAPPRYHMYKRSNRLVQAGQSIAGPSSEGENCRYEWQVLLNGQWHGYGGECQRALEEAFRSDLPRCLLLVGGKQVVVDVHDMLHIPCEGNGVPCPVRRKTVSLSTWEVETSAGRQQLSREASEQLDILLSRGGESVCRIAVGGRQAVADLSQMVVLMDGVFKLHRTPARAAPRAAPSQLPLVTPATVMQQKADRFKEGVLRARADLAQRKLEEWTQQQHLRRELEAVLKYEKLARRRITHDEDVQRRGLVGGLAEALFQTDREAMRTRRAQNRHLRQEEREHREGILLDERAERIAAEREEMVARHAPSAFAILRDELQRREAAHRGVLECLGFALRRAVVVQGDRETVRIRAVQKEKEATSQKAEAVWVDLDLRERQHRQEITDLESFSRRDCIVGFRRGEQEITDTLRARAKHLEELERQMVERRAQETWRLVTEEQRKRMEVQAGEDREWVAIELTAEKNLDVVHKAREEMLLREERERTRALEAVRQELVGFEALERRRVVDLEQVEWDRVMLESHRLFEITQRPIYIASGTVHSPAWVVKQANPLPIPVCPCVHIRRRPNVPYGDGVVTKAILHCVPLEGDITPSAKSDTLILKSAECDPRRILPSQVLQRAQATLYRPNTDPPMALALIGQPETSAEDLGLPVSRGALRLEFSQILGVESFHLSDIELVLRELHYYTTEPLEDRELYIGIFLNLTLAPRSPDGQILHYKAIQCEAEQRIRVQFLPPLISIDTRRSLGYDLKLAKDGRRAPLPILPSTTMPTTALPEEAQRSYSGGSVQIRFLEGITPSDIVTLAPSATLSYTRASGAITFEGQDAAMVLQHILEDGTLVTVPSATPPPTRQKGRKSVKGPSTPSLTPLTVDHIITIQLHPQCKWPEGRVQRFLQSLVFENHTDKPERPKRVLDITITEDSRRDPHRAPLKSSVQVEINILFADDPTFWVMNPASRRSPFSVYRGGNKLTAPPKHASAIESPYSLLCPDAKVQNQNALEYFRGGHLVACVTQGAWEGDTVTLAPGDERLEMGEAKSKRSGIPVLWKGAEVAKAFHFLTRQMPTLRLEFNRTSAEDVMSTYDDEAAVESSPSETIALPTMEAVECIVRRLAFTNTSKRAKVGNRSVMLELLVNDPHAPLAEPLRTSLSCRILPPAVEVALSSAFCSYVEDQGFKRLAIFDIPTHVDKHEDESLNFFDGGTIEVSVVDGWTLDDQFVVQETVSCDYRIKSERDEVNDMFHTIYAKDGANLVDNPTPLASYKVPARGEPLRIQLGKQCQAQAYYDSSGVLQVTPSRPWIRPKVLKSILGGISYQNTANDTAVLHKLVRVEVTDWAGASSQAIVEVGITPINNPTEIVLKHHALHYRQGSASVLNGLCLFPEASLHDVDTVVALEGAFLSVEIISGESQQDSLYLRCEGPEDEIYVDGKALYVYSEKVGTVHHKEKGVGRGTTIVISFSTAVLLENCAEVLRRFTYSNKTHPVHAGVRTYMVKFNAADGVADSRAKVDVHVHPPLIWTPKFAKSLTYVEGSGPVPINPKIMSGLPVHTSIAGGRLRAEIVEGYWAAEDEIGFEGADAFEVDEQGRITGRLLGFKGKFIGTLECDTERQWLEISFPPDSMATVKVLNNLFKAISYRNISMDPSTVARKVVLTLDMENSVSMTKTPAWPSEGIGTGVVDVIIEVTAVDNQTVLEPKYPGVTHVVDQEDKTLLFDECVVEDDDTPMFHAPHSFVGVELRPVNPAERMSFADHAIGFSEYSEVEVVSDMVKCYGVTVGRLFKVTTPKGLRLRIELQDCKLEYLRHLIQNLSYQYLGILRNAKPAKYIVFLTVRGGDRVPITKVSVQVYVVPKAFELVTGFHESGKAYVAVNAYCRTPLHLTGNVILLRDLPSVAGAYIECRFAGIRVPYGDGYFPQQGPVFLSSSRKRCATVVAPARRTRAVDSTNGSSFGSPEAESLRLQHLEPAFTLSGPASSLTSEGAGRFFRGGSATSMTSGTTVHSLKKRASVGRANKVGVDFPEAHDRLFFQPMMPLHLSPNQDSIWMNKDRVAFIERIENARGTHGIRATLVKNSKASVAILESLLQSIWYEYGQNITSEAQSRRVCVCLTIGYPCDPKCKDLFARSTDYYCISVHPHFFRFSRHKVSQETAPTD